MRSICLYFQVHQPFRLRKDYNFFDVGMDHFYEDYESNRAIARKVAQKCYLPTNRLMLDLINKYGSRFKVSYAISGVALEQFDAYCPDVKQSFLDLVETGCVELINETYYHSLSFLYSREEFREQILLHRAAMKDIFGVEPSIFRNTELIYHNDLAQEISMLGFKAMLMEGADRTLNWRSPNYVYKPKGISGFKLLLKNYRLSDDIAFRFSNKKWQGFPLTADKFSHWIHQDYPRGQVINLFMDYETFGEHQWSETGIFEFLKHFPREVLEREEYEFLTPSEVFEKYDPVGDIDAPDYVSWADEERDLTAWLGNEMQEASLEAVYKMEQAIKSLKNPTLTRVWRKLQTSDHFYYMCTKWANDGDVHKYFSPFDSPYDAFVVYNNVLSDLALSIKNETCATTSNF